MNFQGKNVWIFQNFKGKQRKIGFSKTISNFQGKTIRIHNLAGKNYCEIHTLPGKTIENRDLNEFFKWKMYEHLHYEHSKLSRENNSELQFSRQFLIFMGKTIRIRNFVEQKPLKSTTFQRKTFENRDFPWIFKG